MRMFPLCCVFRIRFKNGFPAAGLEADSFLIKPIQKEILLEEIKTVTGW
jgi:hypothetical protein